MVVLFVLGMVFSSAKSSCYLSPNQESYRIQMKALEGKMTDEKEKIVLELCRFAIYSFNFDIRTKPIIGN